MPTIVDATYSREEIQAMLRQVEGIEWDTLDIVQMATMTIAVKREAYLLTEETLPDVIGKFDAIARAQVADGKRVEIVRVTREKVKVRFVEAEGESEEGGDASGQPTTARTQG